MTPGMSQGSPTCLEGSPGPSKKNSWSDARIVTETKRMTTRTSLFGGYLSSTHPVITPPYERTNDHQKSSEAIGTTDLVRRRSAADPADRTASNTITMRELREILREIDGKTTGLPRFQKSGN
jgi:hypothetical protein